MKGKNKASEAETYKKLRHALMMKTLFQYKLLRVKQKISFHAMIKNRTLKEFLLLKILFTNRTMRDTK